MVELTKEILIAYDSFLYSEMVRHQEDIDAIIKKRKVLESVGCNSRIIGSWITEEEIKNFKGYL